MSRVRLSISATAASKDDHVEIDGHDLTKAVRSVAYTAGPPGDLSRLTVDFVIRERIDLDGEAEVDVPDRTRTALTALGWALPAHAEALRARIAELERQRDAVLALCELPDIRLNDTVGAYAIDLAQEIRKMYGPR